MLSGASPLRVGLFEGGERILIFPKQAEGPAPRVLQVLQRIWVVSECKVGLL